MGTNPAYRNTSGKRIQTCNLIARKTILQKYPQIDYLELTNELNTIGYL